MINKDSISLADLRAFTDQFEMWLADEEHADQSFKDFLLESATFDISEENKTDEDYVVTHFEGWNGIMKVFKAIKG